MIAKREKIFLTIQYGLLISYALLTAYKLKPFSDEIITIAGNYGLLFDFDSYIGLEISGHYSSKITNGPISTIGSVIIWHFTKNLYFARFINFLILLVINYFFVSKITKFYNLNKYNFLIYTNFVLVIFIEWENSLYSLGETITTLILFYSILLLDKNPSFSTLLISLCIFFGKILNILILVPLLIYMFMNKISFREAAIPFLSVFGIWLFIHLSMYNDRSFYNILFEGNTKLRYENYYHKGNIWQFFDAFYKTYFENNLSLARSSSIENIFVRNINYFLDKNWNISIYLRLILFPLLIMFTLIYKILTINNDREKNIFTVFLISPLPFYLWFLIINTTKWPRYSIHFILFYLLVSIYLLLTSENGNKFINYIISISVILFLNNMILFIFSVGVLTFLFFIKNNNKLRNLILPLFLTVNILLSMQVLINKENVIFNFDKCIVKINSYECVKEYVQHEDNT